MDLIEIKKEYDKLCDQYSLVEKILEENATDIANFIETNNLVNRALNVGSSYIRLVCGYENDVFSLFEKDKLESRKENFYEITLLVYREMNVLDGILEELNDEKRSLERRVRNAKRELIYSKENKNCTAEELANTLLGKAIVRKNGYVLQMSDGEEYIIEENIGCFCGSGHSYINLNNLDTNNNIITNVEIEYFDNSENSFKIYVFYENPDLKAIIEGDEGDYGNYGGGFYLTIKRSSKELENLGIVK